MKSTGNRVFEVPPRTEFTKRPVDVAADALAGKAASQRLIQALSRESRRCHRYRHPIAIALCDIDRLKLINDGFGRHAGDEVLQEFYSRARHVLRECDWIARCADDEFAVVLPETDLAGAALVAERLRKTMAERAISTEGGDFNFTVSVGYCATESPPAPAQLSAADLLQTASEQLGIAVRNGRNVICGAGAQRAQTANCRYSDTHTLTTVSAPERLALVEYDGTPATLSAPPRQRK